MIFDTSMQYTFSYTHLVGFAWMWDQHTGLPPAVALMSADGPEQHVGCFTAALVTLLDVQSADVWAKHVVPEGEAKIRVLTQNSRTYELRHFFLLRSSR